MFAERVADRLAALPGVAGNVPLHGELPRPEYPAALRERAPAVWRDRGSRILAYADGLADRGAQCAGLVAQGATHAAHAVLAVRGEWVTNEKGLLARAGLDGVPLTRPDEALAMCAAAVNGR